RRLEDLRRLVEVAGAVLAPSHAERGRLDIASLRITLGQTPVEGQRVVVAARPPEEAGGVEESVLAPGSARGARGRGVEGGRAARAARLQPGAEVGRLRLHRGAGTYGGQGGARRRLAVELEEGAAEPDADEVGLLDGRLAEEEGLEEPGRGGVLA